MSLFLGNLSRDATDSEIQKAFEAFGECKVNLRGNYGFVEFTSDKDAEEAKTGLQGKTFGGSALNIEWSKKSGRFSSKETHRRERRDGDRDRRDNRRGGDRNHRGRYDNRDRRGSRRSRSRSGSNSRKHRSDRDRGDRGDRRRDDRGRDERRSRSGDRKPRRSPKYSPVKRTSASRSGSRDRKD